MAVCNCCGVSADLIAKDGTRLVHEINSDTCIEEEIELGHFVECSYYFDPEWKRECLPCSKGLRPPKGEKWTIMTMPPGSCSRLTFGIM